MSAFQGLDTNPKRKRVSRYTSLVLQVGVTQVFPEFEPSPFFGLVQNRVTVHKPDAQAKDPALCKTTSRNKRLREWFESLDPSLARQACRLEVVTLRLTRFNRARFSSS